VSPETLKLSYAIVSDYWFAYTKSDSKSKLPCFATVYLQSSLLPGYNTIASTSFG